VLKAVTIPVNQAVFMLLVAAGVQYLVANVVTVAVFTLVNYVACHLWAFRLARAAVRSTPSPR
jgi:putative flippase GtrA